MKKLLSFHSRVSFLLILLLFIVTKAKPGCNPTSSNVTISACKSVIFNNQTFNMSGTYTQTLINASGCDSFITLNLVISNINTSVVRMGFNLVAIATDATFQWLDCNNHSIVIPGKTSANFYPADNGNYAVVITWNSCTDTSTCYDISGIGIDDFKKKSTYFIVYPNPAKDILNIPQQSGAGCSYSIFNSLGQAIITGLLKENEAEINISALGSGIYLIRVEDSFSRFIKE